MARREIFFRPDRHKYITRKKTKSKCVFCDAAKRGVSVKSLAVYVDDSAIVVLNKYPYNAGHVLVLPRRHVSDWKDFSDQEYARYTWLMRETSRILQECFEPHGINIGLNLGRAAGAGLPDHLHMHFVPRWHGDTNFMPILSGTKVISQSLGQTFKVLAPAFRRLVPPQDAVGKSKRRRRSL